MNQTKYSLELYVSPEFQRELKLRTNKVSFSEINGPIPQLGSEIEVSYGALTTNENELTNNDIATFNSKIYKVTRVRNIISKTKKGLDSKITVIGHLD